MNPTQGTIMISYTDGDDTQDYMKLQSVGGDKALEKAVMKDIRELFPRDHIPNPVFFRSHPWETGCTYWLPGSYSPQKASEAATHPLPSKLPGVWLCGESWSMRQCWVEGALEHTREMLKKINK
jgi:monoamine oxidase